MLDVRVLGLMVNKSLPKALLRKSPEKQALAWKNEFAMCCANAYALALVLVEAETPRQSKDNKASFDKSPVTQLRCSFFMFIVFAVPKNFPRLE